MKNTRRILAVVLTLVMVFTFTFTIAAETDDAPLTAEPWVAPENGTNIIAGNTSCAIKEDRGNLPEITDGICGDKPSDNYWSAGHGGAAVPGENPIENGSGAWFQINLDAICEIDAIRVVTLLNDAAIYHWEAYATDDASKALSEWTFIGAKTTDEISNAEGTINFRTKSVSTDGSSFTIEMENGKLKEIRIIFKVDLETDNIIESDDPWWVPLPP